MSKWNETFYELSNGTKFSIVHNLPMKGNINSIQAAFDNWLVRTDDHTAESFVEYINSKDAGYTAMTKEKYEQLNK
jgi:hypothetical protein